MAGGHVVAGSIPVSPTDVTFAVDENTLKNWDARIRPLLLAMGCDPDPSTNRPYCFHIHLHDGKWLCRSHDWRASSHDMGQAFMDLHAAIMSSMLKERDDSMDRLARLHHAITVDNGIIPGIMGT